MKTSLSILTFCLYSGVSWCSITPGISMPDSFNQDSYTENNLFEHRGYYPSLGSDCGHVTFKDFTPEPYRSRKDEKNSPVYRGITLWYCDIEGNVKDEGYGPGRLLPEKVYFDEKTGRWKKKKYQLGKSEIKESLSTYNIRSLKALKPVVLYNIESVNARGYAVIDSNIPTEDRSASIPGKMVTFCLIRNGDALCGSGQMVYMFDGKIIDFTPYMLKSLETVEIGLPEAPEK